MGFSPAEECDTPGQERPEEPGEEEPAAAPWDVLDWVSLGLSLDAFVQDPSLENLGWLLLDVAGALLPVLPALGLARNADRLIGSANAELAQKAIFVGTPNGSVVPIPKGFEASVARNERGIVFQKPGSSGNANMVRVMDPGSRHPQGYVIYYNHAGHPLDVSGSSRYLDNDGQWRQYGSSDPRIHHDLGGPQPQGYKDWFDGYNQ